MLLTAWNELRMLCTELWLILKSGRGVDIMDRQQAFHSPIRHRKSGVHSNFDRVSDWQSLAIKLMLPCGCNTSIKLWDNSSPKVENSILQGAVRRDLLPVYLPFVLRYS